MELIHTSLKIFEKEMGFRLYMPGNDAPTIFDILLYNEISQILFMLDHYKSTTKSSLYKNKGGSELEELMEYENLNKWFTRTMANQQSVFNSLKHWDSQMREGILSKILHK